MIKLPEFEETTYFVYREPDPDKRDEAYYLKNVRAFYSEWINDASMVGYSDRDVIDFLRSFAEGRQLTVYHPSAEDGEKKNAAILDINGNAVEHQEDFYPVINWSEDIWDVLSPANKIMEALTSKLSKIDFEVSCDPLDPSTIHSIETEKLNRWSYMKNRARIQFAAQLAGVKIPEPDFLPETPEDLDQNTEMFLPDHARYIEQVVKHSFDISHWDPHTLLQVHRDLLVYKKACVKNDYDPEDGKVHTQYIDIKDAGIQKSAKIDCSDSERGYHFYTISISQLRQYFPDEDEEFFQTAAQQFCGYFGNPKSDIFQQYINTDDDKFGYDPFKVLIGNFEWIDINVIKEVVSESHGRKIVKEVPLSSDEDRDKVVRFRQERMRFQAKWLVGTDGIFEYGPSYDVTYPSKNDTELTYKWISLPGKSVVEQLVPIFKNFYDLWLKYKELLRNSQGKIQFIDIDMLATVDGEESDPNKAAKNNFRRFLASYKLLYRRINAAGIASNNQPINEMDGGMGSLFGEIQLAFKMNMELVEYITGINPLTMGQSADPNAPVKTSQLAFNATSDILLSMVNGTMRLKQMIAENLARWIVVLIRGNEYSRAAYESVIGEYGIQALIAANKDEAGYGFKLIPRPTDMEKQWLFQNLEIATTPMQNGEREISTADANIIFNMIVSGTPMKTIQYFFEKARQRQKKAIELNKLMLMQQQSQLNQQDAQVSAERAGALQSQQHAESGRDRSKK